MGSVTLKEEEDMRDVSIIGVGRTKFGALKDKTIRDLIMEAGTKALTDSGLRPEQIQALFVGNYASSDFVKQNHIAPFAATALGLQGIPAVHIENACASSGSALREAWVAVAAGLYDFALVMGVEKMTATSTAETTQILSGAGDWELEATVGATFPSLFAMVARRHMSEYGTTRWQMAQVAVKNHANALKNPYAHMHKSITVEDVLNSPMVADPLTRFDCSLITDGATAVVIAPKALAKEFQARPVDILASAQASELMSLHQAHSLTSFTAAKRAAQQAYEQAGVSPREIDLAEVHDCFTIAEIVALEDLGFVGKGEGGPATADGFSAPDGKLPVNLSGGLKAKGHPVGATGVGMVVELVEQMRGEAGERQVKRAEVGLAHNVGGSGATCNVQILRKGF